MKVVHISSGDTGGAGIAAVRLNRALNSIGVDSKLLCVHKALNEPNIVRYQPSLFRKVLYHSHLPIGQNKYLKLLGNAIPDSDYEAVSFPEALYDISQSPLVKEADVVNLHWVGNILNYRKFFAHVDKPIVWTLHDMNPFLGVAHYMGDYDKNVQHRILEERVSNIKYSAISHHPNLTIVDLCGWMRGYAIKSKSFQGREHVIIPNSIDVDVFTERDKESCRKVLGLPLNEPIILFCAQAVANRRKGFDILLESLCKINHRCHLAIIGNINAANIPGHIKFTSFGTVNDELLMSMIYSASDAFVLPSREDNLPNTMVESLCCGTPVIAFSNGGMRDTITTGLNGILVEEQTPEALSSAINMFLANQTFDNSRICQEAHEAFNPTRQAKSYLKLYESLTRTI